MSQKLIVLSIDALFYEDMEYMRTLPYFGQMIQKASYAKGGMRCIYPSLTYPAHASMITGAYPERHGIFQNEVFDVGNSRPDWLWNRKNVKVDTILDAAKRAGLTTGCINWPTMAGAPEADYLISEVWSEEPGADQLEVHRRNTSKKALPILEKYFFKWHHGDQPRLDFFMTSCAVDIIKEEQPDILFIHLAQLDHTRHEFGLYGFCIEQALTVLNENFGRLVEATKEAGNYENTNFVIVGDHGQVPVNRMFNPNVLFTEAGLIELDGQGKVKEWKAWANSAALSCQVVLRNPEDTVLRERVEALLSEICKNPEYGVEGFMTEEECLREYHLKGNFQYVMEGCGTCFGPHCTGPVVAGPDNSNYKYAIASHGHLPHKGAQPAFIAAGPAFRENFAFPRQHMVDEAPTYARIFGLNLPDAQGRVLDEIFK